jgi:hypothetical protein
MSCRGVRGRFSAYLDQELPAVESRAVATHLGRCPACREHWESLRESVQLLAEAPRLASPDRVAIRVLDRLEIETRGPSLALLFRPAWFRGSALLTSLVPAALVLASILAAALALDVEPRSSRTAAVDTWQTSLPPSGTEANPFFPSPDVSTPQVLTRATLADELLTGLGERTLFFETVVARDGTVLAVNLLEGDVELARPILEALRGELFEPGRFRGNPVAVSFYRLFSRTVVRAS